MKHAKKRKKTTRKAQSIPLEIAQKFPQNSRHFGAFLLSRKAEVPYFIPETEIADEIENGGPREEKHHHRVGNALKRVS